jgi:hypothetical protein
MLQAVCDRRNPGLILDILHNESNDSNPELPACCICVMTSSLTSIVSYDSSVPKIPCTDQIFICSSAHTSTCRVEQSLSYVMKTFWDQQLNCLYLCITEYQGLGYELCLQQLCHPTRLRAVSRPGKRICVS